MSSEMRGVGVQRPKTYSEPASVPVRGARDLAASLSLLTR